MAGLFTPPFFDVGSGIKPADGAKLSFKIVGSDTDKDTYTTAAADIEHSNPVIADSVGVFAQIFITGDYDWILTNKNDVQISEGTVSEFQTVTSAEVITDLSINHDYVADMKAEPTPIAERVVKLKDYALDRGAGVMTFITKASTGVDDGGAIINHDSLAFRYEQVFGSSVDVTQWGVKLDLTDESVAMQNAISRKGRVTIPAGVVVAAGIDIDSNTQIVGAGRDATEIRMPVEGAAVNAYCLAINKNGGTPDPADNIKDVYISDMHVSGSVVTDGFSEFKHLLNFSAFTNLTLERMKVTGARGDHIILGAGATAGLERYNFNFVCDDLIIDGINNDNRNGISIITIDGFKLTNWEINNCTRSDMPAPIDFEPNNDPVNNQWYRVFNVSISEGKIDNCRGGVRLFISTSGLLAPKNFNIRNVLVENGKTNGIALDILYSRNRPTEQSQDHNISVENFKAKDGYRPIRVNGTKGTVINNCSFNSFTQAGDIGVEPSGGVGFDTANMDLIIQNSSFGTCGTSSGEGIVFSWNERMTLKDNAFSDMGVLTAGGAQIAFNENESFGLKLIRNSFFKTGGTTGGRMINASNHTFQPETNIFEDNIIPTENRNSQFPAYRTDYPDSVQNTFTPSENPSVFPPGVSTAFQNSPPGGGLPAAETQGMMKTENFNGASPVDNIMRQTFDDRGAGTRYFRTSVDLNTWGAWQIITSTTA
ncbi:MAG: hypothetical protein COB12_11965 [Flavobacterium sp.]|nr:MAG: hypothetical protein COB12_11965 [Flavobacterium sp.]